MKKAQTFEKFLKEKRTEQNETRYKSNDWDIKRDEWLNAINELYKKVDEIIVWNLKIAGYDVRVEKEEINITEDIIGSYTANNYIIKTDKFKIHFSPVGAIVPPDILKNTQNVNGKKKPLLNTLIYWGASIVILGLMFKILHWRGGKFFMAAGLMTEAFLFFILGFSAMQVPKTTQSASYNGRVDMILPKREVKLLLTEKNEWKIVKDYSGTMELVDFDEKNIQRIFEDNI